MVYVKEDFKFFHYFGMANYKALKKIKIEKANLSKNSNEYKELRQK